MHNFLKIKLFEKKKKKKRGLPREQSRDGRNHPQEP
jgi:hypothetical protein